MWLISIFAAVLETLLVPFEQMRFA